MGTVFELKPKQAYETPDIRDLGESEEIKVARLDDARRVKLDEFVAEVTGA